MPGIVGLITKMPRESAEPQLQQMVAAIRHESFYVTGTWIDESVGVYVGWAARANSFADGMPLFNERGDITLAFSGEEYPEPGIVRRLKERGHARPEKGSSYLVHLYEDDPAFPASLNGRFHGLVIDRSRGTSLLFNDRYGMHRLYYHEAKEAFYFAAEAKAILAVRPELRRTDARGLGEFVSCGCVLENRTLFEGIHVLPTASAWSFRAGAIERKKTYFRPREWEEQAPVGPGKLLPGTSRGVLSEPSTVFQRAGKCWNVTDRRPGHPHDHGLEEACHWLAPMLHIWGHVPGLPGRHHCPKSGSCL